MHHPGRGVPGQDFLGGNPGPPAAHVCVLYMFAFSFTFLLEEYADNRLTHIFRVFQCAYNLVKCWDYERTSSGSYFGRREYWHNQHPTNSAQGKQFLSGNNLHN